MSEKTVAVYLTKTEIGDIWQGLHALTNLLDSSLVPRVALLREQFHLRYKAFDSYHDANLRITFCRPAAETIQYHTDMTESYVAMTMESYDDIMNKLSIKRLESELHTQENLKACYFEKMLERDKSIRNLEAQRDILIRAVGDYGNMVKS